ncbi:TPA: hypothetical protein ACPOXY_001822 [Haemophilus influenzae]|jgi:hypothetical protein
MATIMQKDVLIEVVAYTQAIISKRTAPNAPRNEDQRFLSNLRDYLYSTAPDKIDYQKTLDDVKNIKEKYKDLPIHSHYL